uniref:Putative secreted protein n=1 Tax=Ixodes ricinus TaxID=34613 RepID=A0A6B0UJP5_IXORI
MSLVALNWQLVSSTGAALSPSCFSTQGSCDWIAASPGALAWLNTVGTKSGRSLKFDGRPVVKCALQIWQSGLGSHSEPSGCTLLTAAIQASLFSGYMSFDGNLNKFAAALP